MLEQVYESVVVPYDLYDGRDAPFNNYLITPPRIYMEAIAQPPGSSIFGLYATQQGSAVGESTVKLITLVDNVYTPFAQLGVPTLWTWDGQTGAFKGRSLIASISILTDQYSMSAAGVLYSRGEGGGQTIKAYDIDTLALSGVEYPIAHWQPTITAPGPFCFDELSDIALLQGGATIPNGVTIRRLSTGVILRQVATCGTPRSIAIGAIGTAYVAHHSGLITVVDYLAGKAVGVLNLPGIVQNTGMFVEWDRVYSRLLFTQHTAEATDGASTTLITGFHSTPVAVGITPPLPLRAPRTGRHVPVVVRAYGDGAELVGGLAVDAVETGAGVLLPASSTTDSWGYAEFNLDCAAEGASTIDAEAEV